MLTFTNVPRRYPNKKLFLEKCNGIYKNKYLREHTATLFALYLTFRLWLVLRSVEGSTRTDLSFCWEVFQRDHKEQSNRNEGEAPQQQYMGCPLLAPGPHKDLIIPPHHPPP